MIKLFHGEKGGVGKSFACIAYIDYLMSKGINPVVIECDTSNPDVMRVCKNTKNIECVAQDLRDKQSFFDFFEIIEKYSDRHIVVNLPASIRGFFTDNNETMADVLKEYDLKFDMFFMINAQKDSIQQLSDTLSVGLKDCLDKVVVVKNLKFGTESDYQMWDECKTREKVIAGGGAEITLPEMSVPVSADVYNKGILFSQLAETEGFSLVKKITLNKWLKTIYSQFESVEK